MKEERGEADSHVRCVCVFLQTRVKVDTTVKREVKRLDTPTPAVASDDGRDLRCDTTSSTENGGTLISV